jgi:hypothetical protein
LYGAAIRGFCGCRGLFGDWAVRVAAVRSKVAARVKRCIVGLSRQGRF